MYLFFVIALLLTLTTSSVVAADNDYTASFGAVARGRCRFTVWLGETLLYVVNGTGSFSFQGRALAEGPFEWQYQTDWVNYTTIPETMKARGMVEASWFDYEGKHHHLKVFIYPTATSVAWLEPYKDFILFGWQKGLRYAGIFKSGDEVHHIEGTCRFFVQQIGGVDPSDSIALFFALRIDGTLYQVTWFNKDTYQTYYSTWVPAAKVFKHQVKIWIP